MARLINRIKDILPNRPFGKTAKDNRVVRLVELNKVIDDINSTLDEVTVPYKVYTAILTQTVGDAPLATELENTLNVNAVYSYDNTGQYTILFDKALFNSPDEYVTISQSSYVDGANNICHINAVPIFFNAVGITTYKGAIPSDDIIGNFFPCILEIRVYNDRPIIPLP